MQNYLNNNNLESHSKTDMQEPNLFIKSVL